MPGLTSRKIVPIGASRAVTLPPDWLNALGLDNGSRLDLVYDSVVLVKPPSMDLDPTFLQREFALLKKRGYQNE